MLGLFFKLSLFILWGAAHSSFGAPSAQDIQSIQLKRTQCFGTCPAFTFVIYANGHWRYEGSEYVDKLGSYKGKVGRQLFTALAAQIESKNFYSLNKSYTADMTDMPTTFVQVQTRGTFKEVMDYGAGGPAALKDIESAIDKTCQIALAGKYIQSKTPSQSPLQSTKNAKAPKKPYSPSISFLY